MDGQLRKSKFHPKTPLDEWNPMNVDFNDETLNTYKSGIGRDMRNAETQGNYARLFVTNFPPELEKIGLKNLFQDELNIHVDVVTTKDKNMKDIAFVTVPTRIASRACHIFNNRQLGQHILTVRVAQSKNRVRDKEDIEGGELDPVYEELKKNYENSQKALQAQETKDFIRDKGTARFDDFPRTALHKGELRKGVAVSCLSWSSCQDDIYVYLAETRRDVIEGIKCDKQELPSAERFHVALTEYKGRLYRAKVLEVLGEDTWIVHLIDICKIITTKNLYALKESMLDLEIQPVQCKLFGLSLTSVLSNWVCIYDIIFEQLLRDEEVDMIVKAVSRGVNYVDFKSELIGNSLCEWLVSKKMANFIPSYGLHKGHISYFRDFQHFYVQFNREKVEHLEYLLNNLEKHYLKNHFVSLKVAKRATDNKWYRVKILEDRSAFFVDYGWIESVVDVRHLPEGSEYLCPPQAQLFHLEDHFLAESIEIFTKEFSGAEIELELLCQSAVRRFKHGSRIYPRDARKLYDRTLSVSVKDTPEENLTIADEKTRKLSARDSRLNDVLSRIKKYVTENSTACDNEVVTGKKFSKLENEYLREKSPSIALKKFQNEHSKQESFDEDTTDNRNDRMLTSDQGDISELKNKISPLKDIPLRKSIPSDKEKYEDIRFLSKNNEEDREKGKTLEKKDDVAKSLDSSIASGRKITVDQNDNKIVDTTFEETITVTIGDKMKKEDFSFLKSIYDKYSGVKFPEPNKAVFVNVIGIYKNRSVKLLCILGNNKLNRLFSEMNDFYNKLTLTTDYEPELNEIVAICFNGEWMRAEKHQNYYFCIDIVYYISENLVEGVHELHPSFTKCPIYVAFVELIGTCSTGINCPTILFGYRTNKSSICAQEVPDEDLTPDLIKLKQSSVYYKMNAIRNIQKKGGQSGYFDTLTAMPVNRKDMKNHNIYSRKDIKKFEFMDLKLTAGYCLKGYDHKTLLKPVSEVYHERNISLNLQDDDTLKVLKQKVTGAIGCSKTPLAESKRLSNIEEKFANDNEKRASSSPTKINSTVDSVGEAKVRSIKKEDREDNSEDLLSQSIKALDVDYIRSKKLAAKLLANRAPDDRRRYRNGDYKTNSGYRDKIIAVKLPVNQQVLGQIIVADDPNSFYFQLDDNKEINQKLEERSRELAEKLGSFPQPKRDMLVLVKRHNKWQRAKVVEVNESKVTVRNLDIGGKCQVNTEDVKMMPEILRCIPPLAVHCSLYGIESKGDKWSAEACKTFKGLVSRQLVSVEATEIIGDFAFVDVFIEGMSLRQSLVNFKLASWANEEDAKEAISKSAATNSCKCKDIELKKLELCDGTVVRVIIYEFNDPSNFTAQVICPEIASALVSLQNEANELFSKDDDNYKIEGEIQIGDLVFAINPDDNLYYRAVVTSVEENTLFQVRFLDFGNESDQLVGEELRAIPEKRFIEDLPPTALKFTLRNCENMNMSPSEKEKFRTIAQTETIMAVVLECKDDKYIIDLEDVHGNPVGTDQ
ncbi:DgyrCDS9146 [Dimorphilus gyrociliatus]|uniref:DgyrCDS9146 n=1 Tax=Dimorphilus gyrociliatus TaxID=2664684 RepID=A0A7I8VWJ2_9ANNE|nr:DgyrCDS9146 [Dimorphilus gyrociliatus]